MANTKNYSTREMIIDRCLSSGEAYSRPQLQDACNRELDRRGEKPVTSKVTILKDLDEIQNKYNVVIDRIRRGHTIYYRYHDRGFSIYNSELSENEYAQLTESLSILKRFEGMPKFEWVDELEARFSSNLTRSNRTIVFFDENKYSTGMEYFSPLFNAISKCQTVKVSYKSFRKKDGQVAIVSPQLLKEYNNRWFLFCIDNNYHTLSIYALDRICGIDKSSQSYITSDIDFDEYFDDIVGVSTTPKSCVEKVLLKVNNSLLPYILTKPLHGSQKMISKDDEGAIMEIEVKPNYELEQMILSLGEGISVLSPTDLRSRIQDRIKAMLDNYED